MSSSEDRPIIGFGGVAGVVLSVMLIVATGMVGCPQYSVYEQRLQGEAELARANYSRQVQVADAEGKLAAAHKLADVEVARAGGVAQANKIIGDSLKNNDDYLRYLWITDIAAGQHPSVIYVPTEKAIPLPVTESFRLPSAPVQK